MLESSVLLKKKHDPFSRNEMDWIPLLARFGMSDKGGYYVGSRRFRLAGTFGKTIAFGLASADTHWFRSISLRKTVIVVGKMEGIPLLARFGMSDKGGTDVGISRFRLAGTFGKAITLGSASAVTLGFHLQLIVHERDSPHNEAGRF